MWSFNRLAFVLVFATHVAFAGEPTPKDVEDAKAQFSEGLELRDKGDLELALARFRSAYALVPTPITALEVGKTELQLGRVKAARETFVRAALLPPKEGESATAKQARADAAKMADQAKQKLAHLKVAYDPQPSSPPEVVLDGHPTTDPDEVDPGHHVIVARSGGKMAREELDLKAGEDRTVTLALTHDDPSAAPQRPTTHRTFKPNAPFWIGAGTAAGGLILGTATGIAAFATAGTVKNECPARLCPASKQGDIDTSKALGWVSTIGFIALGVGVGLAVVGLATSFKVVEEKPAWIFGPGTIGRTF